MTFDGKTMRSTVWQESPQKAAWNWDHVSPADAKLSGDKKREAASAKLAAEWMRCKSFKVEFVAKGTENIGLIKRNGEMAGSEALFIPHIDQGGTVNKDMITCIGNAIFKGWDRISKRISQ